MPHSSDASPSTPPASAGRIDSVVAAVARALDLGHPAPPAFVQPLARGVLLGRYELVRELGKGGMGTVWEATHRISGRRVALKLLRNALYMSPRMRDRFVREARLATAVDHPGVVRVHDVFEVEGGLPVMVMDLLEGETLGDRLRRDGPMPARDACEAIESVVDVVRAAHRAGVVHRDLKPDNVYLVASPGPIAARVRVLDFGIAKFSALAAQEHREASLTETGALLGTPQYMAPEQLLGQTDIDERSDVWALGVMLHECLTGQRPLEGNNVGALVQSLGTRPTALRRNGLPVSSELAQALAKMLQVDRDRRFCDLAALQRILVAEAARGVRPVRRAGGTLRSRLTWSLAAIAATGLAGALALRAADDPARSSHAMPPPSDSQVVLPSAHPRLIIEPQVSRSSPWGTVLDVWRRAVTARTGGAIEPHLKWTLSGLHDGDSAALSRLRTGQTDGALVALRTLARIDGEVAAMELPGFVDAWPKVDWVREHLRARLTRRLSDRGYELLAFRDIGCERIMSARRDVRRPRDLERERIAIAEDDLVGAALLSTIPRSIPVPMPSSQLAGGLERPSQAGVLGVIGTAADAFRFRWNTWMDRVTTMPLSCTSGALVLRRETLAKMGAEHRAILTDLAMRLEGEGNYRARQVDTEASLRLRRELTAVEVSETDRRAWRHVFERGAERSGQGLLSADTVREVRSLSAEIDGLR